MIWLTWRATSAQALDPGGIVSITIDCPGKTGLVVGRGLHSSTFRLDVTALYGIGGAFRVVQGGSRGVQGYQQVFRVYIVSETAQVELESGQV